MGNYEGGLFSTPRYMIKTFNQGAIIFDNFVKAVRSRKVEDFPCRHPRGALVERSVHLGNVSYRLRRIGQRREARRSSITPGRKTSAWKHLERVKHHMDDKHVDLREAHVQFGAMLKVDGQSETFRGR